MKNLSTMNNILTVKNLEKTYYTLSGEVKALDNISFSVNEGDFIAIVGASGCGKSTLLNILADIDKDYKGNINYYKKNKIGYMLQQDALLPWLSIRNNCLLGVKLHGGNDEKLVDLLLKKYDLYDFKDKKPSSLSGGMKQRCSLIRTLALKPDILLLDEPFSALDYQSKLSVENDVYKIIKEEKKTAIMVTHDISEAIAMANKIIVLSSRPSRIINIYDIKLKDNKDPIHNRGDVYFSKYFDMIWRDLNENVS